MEIRKTSSGLLLKHGGKKYAIDKVPRNIAADIHLVSHAHTDHLPKASNLRVLASDETISLARERGCRYLKVDEDKYKDIEMIESGHILGSRAFLIDGKILYTGDINIYDRLFLKGFKPPQADILIIEATYGDARYRFGDFPSILDKLLGTLSRYILRGRNIILQAHPLGKPQIISEVLNWYPHTYVTPSVYRYNKIYEEHGAIKNIGIKWDGEPTQPFILISSMASRSARDIVEKYRAIQITLSGWMVSSRTRGFPLSDHADFYDLMRVVDRVSPRKVYTMFGFADKLAGHLRNYGYDAEPLR